ncbi:hypothetical protein BC826DRAFT_927094 [Russula brevipes]|nr:hypothetical protein BC826DRAFT_927094 [Russula brevipes]
MYRLITGHAFVGAYTQRFYANHTPEQIACPCGEPIQTIEHVLMVCPLHNAAQHKHLMIGGRVQNFNQLFKHKQSVQAILHFLEESGACAKPRIIWDPG